VWPSAISLAQQLLQRPELVAGKKVADLGAGLGVAGIAAALAGAAEVVLLDREPLALQCALLSGAASRLQSVQGLEGVQLQQLAAAQQQQQQHGASSFGDTAAEVPPQQQQHAASHELLQLAQLYVQQRAQQLQQQQQEQQQELLHSDGRAKTSSSSSSSSSHNHSAPGNTSSRSSSSSTGVLRASTFDWSSQTVPERFDVVLACDGEQRMLQNFLVYQSHQCPASSVSAVVRLHASLGWCTAARGVKQAFQQLHSPTMCIKVFNYVVIT
jgi:16S rRNA G966 N2-methylase RsmD